MQQFVYKLVSVDSHKAAAVADGCQMVSSVADWGRWFIPIMRILGPVDTVKLFIQWLRANKSIYFWAENNQIKSYGIISFGYCKLYNVEPDSAVIGPVNTLSSCQGRGLATLTLCFATERLFKDRGCSAVYIDTAENNLKMQRVIEKVGFSGPILAFPRTKVAS